MINSNAISAVSNVGPRMSVVRKYPRGKQIVLSRMRMTVMDSVPEDAFMAGQRAYVSEMRKDNPEYLGLGDYADLLRRYRPACLTADSVEQWEAFFILGWSSCVLGVDGVMA